MSRPRRSCSRDRRFFLARAANVRLKARLRARRPSGGSGGASPSTQSCSDNSSLHWKGSAPAMFVPQRQRTGARSRCPTLVDVFPIRNRRLCAGRLCPSFHYRKTVS